MLEAHGSPGCRVAARDRHGHDPSSQPWVGNDRHLLTEDLAAVPDALPLKDTVRVARVWLVSAITPAMPQ